MYTELSHDKLNNKLSAITDFAFIGGNNNLLNLLNLKSTNGTTFWGKKTKGALGYSRASLKPAVNHLIKNCYFKVGNTVK